MAVRAESDRRARKFALSQRTLDGAAGRRLSY